MVRPVKARSSAAWVAAGVLAFAAPSAAIDWKILPDDEWCDDVSSYRHEAHCEAREAVVVLDDGLLRLDGVKNGGISVWGDDRQDVLVQALVRVWNADDEEEAREVAESIELEFDGHELSADGPRRSGRPSWGVSYRVWVPEETDLDLETYNGGIKIEGVSGEIDFRTYNGGVNLEDLAGEVRGETHNGGVSVELTGDTWNGRGLDVSTKNGGVELRIPENYSADLRTGTVNGRVKSDFRLDEDHRDWRRGHKPKKVHLELGEGGPEIRVTTKNGGVRLRET